MVKVQWSLIRQNKRFLVWALLNRVSVDLLRRTLIKFIMASLKKFWFH